MNRIVRGILGFGIALACVISLSFQDVNKSFRETFKFSSKWQKHEISVNEGYPAWTSTIEWQIKVPSPSKGVPEYIIIQANHEFKYKYIAWNMSDKQGTGERFFNIKWWTEGSFEGMELPTMSYTVKPFRWIFDPFGIFWDMDRPKLTASFGEYIVLDPSNMELNPDKKKWTLKLKGLDNYEILFSVPVIFGSSIKEKLTGTITYVY